LLGHVLELRARSQMSSAIRALLDLRPKRARPVRDEGSEADVAMEEVVSDYRRRVQRGEKVPVDGVVLEGRSAIDEDTLLRKSSSWALRRSSRAPIQGLADVVSGWFVPAAGTIAALAFVVWWLVGPVAAMGSLSSMPSPS
jgi:P-type Cu+ transporter